jgi:hypothetical protein
VIAQKSAIRARPRLLGLFEKKFEGDDALLELARLRFIEAGLGMECHAGTAAELEQLLSLSPDPEASVTAHLSRSLNLLEERDRQRVMDFARIFRRKIYGLVVHDQREIADRFDEYVAAACALESALRDIEASPYFFLEYATGLDPELFVRLFRSLKNTELLSACIDIGHLGLRRVREVYSISHPGKDVCDVKPDDGKLSQIIEDVQYAVRAAVDHVVGVVRELASLGKPLHFHLHDGHPLSTYSPYGVSDHLSFLAEIPIPFDYGGRRSLPPMFGLRGLGKIIGESLALLRPELLSFVLEIHPTEGRLPLGNAQSMFRHWQNKLNAERMNFWLSILAQNRILVSEMCAGKAFSPDSKTLCSSKPGHEAES